MAPLLSGILCVLLLCNVALAQEEGDVRLVDGQTYLEGRVEIYHNGKWGTVCDDRFGEEEGTVICKSLNFAGLNTFFPRATYGQGKGEIWMDELECSGNEVKLAECKFAGWGNHNCNHREDAGVKCDPKPVTHNITVLPLRVSCPPNVGNGSCSACPPLDSSTCFPQIAVQGILEAQIKGHWFPVTGDGWGPEESNVACSQLGYSASWPSPSLDQLWPNWNKKNSVDCNASGSGTSDRASGSDTSDGASGCDTSEVEEYHRHLMEVLMKKPVCTGYEQTLLNCSFASVDRHSIELLDRNSVATVACGNSLPRTEECFPSNYELYRLRGGPVPWAGRVEVKAGGAWTTVCDDNWDTNKASLVCRSLGYGTAKTIHKRSYFGRGSGNIGYAELQCPTYASTLGMCSYTSKVPKTCDNHAGDAGVVCHHPQPDNSCPGAGPHSRLHTVFYPNSNSIPSYHHLVEIKHNGVWGRLCYGAVDIHVANTVCKESQGMFADTFTVAEVRIETLHEGLHFNGSILCHGEETSIDKCQTQLEGHYTTCSSGYAAVYCIQGMADLVPSLADFENSLHRHSFVDESYTMSHLQCAVDDNCLAPSASTAGPSDYRSLLRFDSMTMNLGTLDFLPPSAPSTWIWHNCHRHYHSYEAFVHYDILNTNGISVAEGHKASFCLEDTFCLPGQNSYYQCLSGIQGISRNCGDLYGRHLDCQWIDITGLPSGNYIIRQEVNPNRLVAESDYRNNIIQCSITYFSYQQFFRYYLVNSCSHSDH